MSLRYESVSISKAKTQMRHLCVRMGVCGELNVKVRVGVKRRSGKERDKSEQSK